MGVTVDGRLFRRGMLDPDVRTMRLREFSTTFAIPDDTVEQGFAHWFTLAQPTHGQLLTFALDPAAGNQTRANSVTPGRCPVFYFR